MQSECPSANERHSSEGVSHLPRMLLQGSKHPMKWMQKQSTSISALHLEDVGTFQIEKLLLKIANGPPVTSLGIKLQVRVDYKIHIV